MREANKDPADQAVPSRRAERQERDDRRRKQFVGGAAVLLIILGLGFWLLGGGAKPPAAEKNAVKGGGIGVVDVRRVLKAHPLYDKLRHLQDEYNAIADKIDALELAQKKANAPQPGDKPFADAVRQKNMQAAIRSHAQLIERLREEEKRYRAATEADFIARRNELESEYAIRIFNIELKLDNAKVMRLSKADVDALLAELTELKTVRAGRYRELYGDYEAQVTAHLTEKAALWREELGIKADETLLSLEIGEMQARGEAMVRNLEAMQKRVQDTVTRQKRLLAYRQSLIGKEKELDALEGQMMKDVVSQATRLALIYRLDIVVAKAPKLLPQAVAGSIRPERLPVFPSLVADAHDITAELVGEFTKYQK